MNNQAKNRYHNDGHITNDIMNNDGNMMVSQEKENYNMINKLPSKNIQNIGMNINEEELSNSNKKVGQSQQQINHFESNNKIAFGNLNNKPAN